MNNYHVTKKGSPIGSTFFGVTFDPAGIPIILFNSLKSIIGLGSTRTKSCPFCEETIKEEASNCRFCHRILMKQMNFKSPK